MLFWNAFCFFEVIVWTRVSLCAFVLEEVGTERDPGFTVRDGTIPDPLQRKQFGLAPSHVQGFEFAIIVRASYHFHFSNTSMFGEALCEAAFQLGTAKTDLICRIYKMYFSLDIQSQSPSYSDPTSSSRKASKGLLIY